MTSPFDGEEADEPTQNVGDELGESPADNRIERLLLCLTPRTAPHDVRERVLARLKSMAPQVVSPARGGWSRIFDFAVAALVLMSVTAWGAGASVHSNRMKQLLGPTSAERRAQRDAQSLDSLASEESIRELQSLLATHYEQVQRKSMVPQSVHSPSLDTLPDLWRNKNAQTDHPDSRRPGGNRSSGRRRLDLESQRTA